MELLANRSFYYQALSDLKDEVDDPIPILKEWAKNDLFFLLVYVLNRVDVDKDWLFDRCREVQENPDGYLDLWSREHYKSTIITFALTIQEILNNPEVTIGVFSHTRPNAKGFLRQIKREFELNETLKKWFPEILYENPSKEAIKWSEDDGIIVKRSSNPKEATIEAWGVVDGQPTGKHFSLLVYDDIVTKESVTTPEMIEKTTDALALSYNLGAHGGRRRWIGTRYHFADTYKTIMDRGTAKPRIHAATHDGSESGDPVFLTAEQLHIKRRDMGPYVFGCQMLQNPIADSAQGFKREWLRYFTGDITTQSSFNWYLLVDAANSKRKGSDYTSMWAVGLGIDGNYYAIPEVRDRLNLTERTERLIDLHRKYRPVEVRYERYGMMADIAYIKLMQEKENYRFDIVEVAGQTSKIDRIKRLVPLYQNGSLYLPRHKLVTDYEGVTRDLVQSFIEEELIPFPVPLHDDMCFIAGTMISTNKGSVAIEHLKAGDMVLTPDGYKPVLACGFTGIKEVITKFSLTGTSNHPIFSIKQGYVLFDTITCINDTIGNDLCGWIKITLLKLSSSTELNSKGWADCVNIIYNNQQRMREGKILKDCMLLFGSFITTRQYLKALRFIIRTAIHLTTCLKILSAYRAVTIGSWYQNLKLHKQEGSERKGLGLLQKHGTLHRKVSNGIGKMLCNVPVKFLSNVSIPVLSVQGYLKLKSLVSLNIAAIYAGNDQGQNLSLARTSTLTSALFVAQNLLGKNKGQGSVLKHAQIRTCGKQERVYNLTVADANCYFANGILVHNCDALSRIQEDEGTQYETGKKIDLALNWPKAIKKAGHTKSSNWRTL